jgi:hypothetical protein
MPIVQQLGAIEDEQAQRAESPRISLMQLAVELAVARASSGDAIRDVRINGNWIVVERGADVLATDGFRLADLVDDHYGFTTAVRRGFSRRRRRRAHPARTVRAHFPRRVRVQAREHNCQRLAGTGLA